MILTLHKITKVEICTKMTQAEIVTSKDNLHIV